MAELKFQLKLEDSAAELKTLINTEIAKKLNKLIPPKIPNIRKRVLEIIENAFYESDTYDAIANGFLKQEFGLRPTEIETKLNAIIDIMMKSLKVTFNPLSYAGGRFSGGIVITAIKKDFEDLFMDPSSSVVTNKGQSLPWLEWLLIEGDSIIITDYEISYGPYPTSRAGGAIMIQNPTGIWRVPPEYSGTKRNNWITKLVNQTSLVKFQIETVIVEEISRI